MSVAATVSYTLFLAQATVLPAISCVLAGGVFGAGMRSMEWEGLLFSFCQVDLILRKVAESQRAHQISNLSSGLSLATSNPPLLKSRQSSEQSFRISS